MASRFELFVTGIPRIDREHQTLVELIERINGICKIANAIHCKGCTLSTRDHCSGGMDALLATLTSYMRKHFRYEEQRMDWFVPNAHVVEHRKDHDMIAARLRTVADEFARERNSTTSARFVVTELRTWLEKHFYEYDGVLAAYIGDEDDDGDDVFID